MSYGTVDYDATIQKNKVYFCILTGEGLQDITGTNQDGEQFVVCQNTWCVCMRVCLCTHTSGWGRASNFVLLYFPELQGKYPVGADINL